MSCFAWNEQSMQYGQWVENFHFPYVLHFVILDSIQDVSWSYQVPLFAQSVTLKLKDGCAFCTDLFNHLKTIILCINLLSLEFSQSVIYKQMLHFMLPLHPSLSWRFVFNSIWDLETDHKKHNTTLQQSYNYQLIEHISATNQIKSNLLLSHKTPTAKTKPVH